MNLKYTQLLGKEQLDKVISFFKEIENGVYNKNKLLTVSLNNLLHPITMRCIRADMQSFVNTFVDPYLEKKDYFGEADFVIDAGGNVGYTAVLFANWWPNATIVSIEPDKENYKLTVENCKPYPNIKVIHGGLWNKTTTLQIEAGQEDGFVVKEFTGKKTNTDNLCEAISIDDILKQYKVNKIDFLKMNIEGSEKEVFAENYSNWLPNTQSLLIELHDGKNAGCSKSVFNTINKYDFAVVETAPYGILFTKEKVYRSWYANWYKQTIYLPNINKERFPKFYLDEDGE